MVDYAVIRLFEEDGKTRKLRYKKLEPRSVVVAATLLFGGLILVTFSTCSKSRNLVGTGFDAKVQVKAVLGGGKNWEFPFFNFLHLFQPVDGILRNSNK